MALSIGSRGQQVRDLQTRLRAQGLYSGRPDGIYGPRTQQGVRQFQQREGLPQTGQADQTTFQRLQAARNRDAFEPASTGPQAARRREGPAGGLQGLINFARSRGFTVTSTTGGRHNPGSAHYRGRAIDVRTRDKTPQQVEQFIRDARAAGYRVRDERRRPAGQRVWSGPHLHLEF